jgi:hypothetical protein
LIIRTSVPSTLPLTIISNQVDPQLLPSLTEADLEEAKTQKNNNKVPLLGAVDLLDGHPLVEEELAADRHLDTVPNQTEGLPVTILRPRLRDTHNKEQPLLLRLP